MFSIHYERVLKESEIDQLKDLFSRTPSLIKEVLYTIFVHVHTFLMQINSIFLLQQKEFGFVQCLTTPTSNKDTIWRDGLTQSLKNIHVSLHCIR